MESLGGTAIGWPLTTITKSSADLFIMEYIRTTFSQAEFHYKTTKPMHTYLNAYHELKERTSCIQDFNLKICIRHLLGLLDWHLIFQQHIVWSILKTHHEPMIFRLRLWLCTASSIEHKYLIQHRRITLGGMSARFINKDMGCAREIYCCLRVLILFPPK